MMLSPPSTAVLIVDMLNDFCRQGGAMVLPGYEALLEPQNALIRAVRESGGVVAFVIDSHRPEARREREFLKRTPHCIEGTWGAQVIEELDQQEGDLHIIKRRYSGFFNTDLDLSLKDMQVDTVIVVGVVTNICVRSTVHDAFFHGYRVIVPENAVAATGPREQESSLYDIGTHFGLVSTSDAVVVALRNRIPVKNQVTA
ncbi:MAG: cysteine hydrolase [Rhodospirillaceae bacterium]|nr:cysteine hydrolase [Rhodospirillaceae bacterium]MCY4240039.1 cysteine hydrolase [Rhodospirillaceae bacterium]